MSRCGAVRIFAYGGDFSWQAQGKPRVFGASKSTFRDRCKGPELLISKCSFRGRCRTLDMVVIVEELKFRYRCSES